MYYKVKVKMTVEQDNGKLKNVTEQYLVKAENIKEAGTIATSELRDSLSEFDVTEISETKFVDVL